MITQEPNISDVAEERRSERIFRRLSNSDGLRDKTFHKTLLNINKSQETALYSSNVPYIYFLFNLKTHMLIYVMDALHNICKNMSD